MTENKDRVYTRREMLDQLFEIVLASGLSCVALDQTMKQIPEDWWRLFYKGKEFIEDLVLIKTGLKNPPARPPKFTIDDAIDRIKKDHPGQYKKLEKNMNCVPSSEYRKGPYIYCYKIIDGTIDVYSQMTVYQFNIKVEKDENGNDVTIHSFYTYNKFYHGKDVIPKNPKPYKIVWKDEL